MESLSSIGRQIVAARKERGLRQIDLAARSGLSRATIDALENGRAGDIGISKLTRILAALGLELSIRPSTGQRPTLDELLKEEDDD
jgi:transcriptional regulator with XRE-family HTH domain